MVDFFYSSSLRTLKPIQIQPNWSHFFSYLNSSKVPRISPSAFQDFHSKSIKTKITNNKNSNFILKSTEFRSKILGNSKLRIRKLFSPATLQVLPQIFKQGPSPDIVTYTTFIKFLGDFGRATEAYELFELMIESHEPDIISFTILIQILCNSEMFDQALHLFQVMSYYNCKPDIFCYNTLIDKLGEMGLESHVSKLWSNMEQHGIRPDVVTYSSLVKSLCVSNKIDEALLVLTYMEMHRKIQPNTYTYNTIITSYLDRKLTKEALGLLGRMEIRGCKPDLCTFNLFIKYYSDFGEGKEAYMFLKCMIRRKIEARESSYRICLNGLMKQGGVNEVLELIEYIKLSSVTLNIFAWNKMILWLSKMGHFDEAYRIFVQLNVDPNEITMNILIQLLYKHGRSEKAWEVFELMKQRKIEASVVTYNILIHGLSKEGMVSKAFELVRRLEDEECNLSPDLITYNCLLDGLCKKREVDEACKLVLEMLKKGFKPDLISYNTLINGMINIGRTDDASRLFEHMKEKFAAHFVPLEVLIEEMLLREQLVV